MSNQAVVAMKLESIVRMWHRAAAMCLLIAGYCIPLHSADTNTCGEHLPVEVILEKLQAANLCRAEALSGYTGKRGYKVDYRGLSWMLLAGAR